jgi:hypothetical protein
MRTTRSTELKLSTASTSHFPTGAPPAAFAGDAGRGYHAEPGPTGPPRRGGEREFHYAAHRTRVVTPALAFIRVCRSSRPHPPSLGSGRRPRVLGSEAPPVRPGRRPRFSDEGPPPAPDRSIVGSSEVAVMRVALVNAPLRSAVCDRGSTAWSRRRSERARRAV